MTTTAVKAFRTGVIVKFGPLTVPVNILTAADDGEKEVALNTVCNAGHDPVRTKRPYICPECKREGGDKDFVKGREIDGTLVVVGTSETVDAAVGVSKEQKESMPLTVHPLLDVLLHTIPFGKTYYLAPPNEKQMKGFTQSQLDEAYTLLSILIKSHPDMAICTTFAFLKKLSMFRLSLVDGVITMEQLAWPEDMRQHPQIPSYPVDETAAVTLLDTFLNPIPFDPSEYVNTSARARAELIEAAANGDPIAAVTSAVTPVAGNVVSMMDQLKAAAEAASTPARKTTRKKAS